MWLERAVAVAHCNVRDQNIAEAELKITTRENNNINTPKPRHDTRHTTRTRYAGRPITPTYIGYSQQPTWSLPPPSSSLPGNHHHYTHSHHSASTEDPPRQQQTAATRHQKQTRKMSLQHNHHPHAKQTSSPSTTRSRGHHLLRKKSSAEGCNSLPQCPTWPLFAHMDGLTVTSKFW